MIKIAHRGNTEGPKPSLENSPSHINSALQKGYNVEIDVWYVGGSLFLGHDKPDYKVSIEYLRNDKFWCHCKNIEALKILLSNNIRCFFHDSDEATLTSDNYIWTYSGKEITSKSICVMPEKDNWNIPQIAAGVCSDYVDSIGEIIG